MEDKDDNNLFFTASLIEYIARITNNEKKYVVDKLGKDMLNKIYELADVYHSENIKEVADDFINKCNIERGNYQLKLNNNLPSFWDMGRIYQRLVKNIDSNKEKYISNLYDVLSSWFIKYLDNYDSSLYYESSEYIYNCYISGKVL